MWGIIIIIACWALGICLVLASAMFDNDMLWQSGCIGVLLAIVAGLIMIVVGLFTQVFPAIGNWIGNLVK